MRISFKVLGVFHSVKIMHGLKCLICGALSEQWPWKLQNHWCECAFILCNEHIGLILSVTRIVTKCFTQNQV